MMQAHRPSRNLLFQCPLCKELVHLERFSAQDGQLSFACSSCEEVSTYTTALRLQDLLQPNAALEKSSSKQAETTAARKEPASKKESVVSAASKEDDLFAKPLESPLPAQEKETAALNQQEKSPSVVLDEPDSQTFCPKCWERRIKGNTSCHKCGLLFANVGVTFDPSRESGPVGAGGREARESWQEVLAAWEDEEAHKQFLRCCQRNDLLEFAAQCYRKERARRGPEALIDKQLDQLLELAQQQFLNARKSNEDPENSNTRIFVLLMMVLGSGVLLLMLLRFWQSGGGMAP